MVHPPVVEKPKAELMTGAEFSLARFSADAYACESVDCGVPPAIYPCAARILSYMAD
jgi:hypothetical protein